MVSSQTVLNQINTVFFKYRHYLNNGYINGAFTVPGQLCSTVCFLRVETNIGTGLFCTNYHKFIHCRAEVCKCKSTKMRRLGPMHAPS